MISRDTAERIEAELDELEVDHHRDERQRLEARRHLYEVIERTQRPGDVADDAPEYSSE